MQPQFSSFWKYNPATGVLSPLDYGPGEQDQPVIMATPRSEEHTSELQSQSNLVCRLLLEKKKKKNSDATASNKQSNRQSLRARSSGQLMHRAIKRRQH